MSRLGAGTILTDRGLVPGDVEIADGRVVALVPPGLGAVGIAAPGFVDLQVNGFAGVDFSTCDADAMCAAAGALARTGVTAFLPTLVTAPPEALAAGLGVIAAAAARRDRPGAEILGAHLEGPFISPAALGAHPAEHRLDPDPDVLASLVDAGPVRKVTLAPELHGGVDAVRWLRSRGIAVAAGHSDATATEAHRGFDAGIGSTTHHGNAMRRFHHREPGLFGAALVRDDVTITVIADGHHLAADTLALLFGAARGGVALVTDAVGLAGADPAARSAGRLGGRLEVRLDDGAVRRPDGGLAGSALTMDRAVRTAVDAGVDVATALHAASCMPRRLAGLDLRSGIEPGAPADLVVLDPDLRVRATLLAGAVHPAGAT